MTLIIQLNLPRFEDTVTAEIELFHFLGDLSVGVDDQIDIESVKINGAEWINKLTWDELYIIERECWRYKDSGAAMDFSWMNNVEDK